MNSTHLHDVRLDELYATFGSQSGCNLTLVTLCDLPLKFETLVKSSSIVSNDGEYLRLAALDPQECFTYRSIAKWGQLDFSSPHFQHGLFLVDLQNT